MKFNIFFNYKKFILKLINLLIIEKNMINRIIKLKITIFLSLIIISFEIRPLPKCLSDSDCLRNHICKDNHCHHKGYFPPNLSQIIEILCMCLLSTVSTAAGVGGGAIYSALLMFIDNFEAQIAFPISSFAIFVCSSLTFYLGVKSKIHNPKMKFIDYDLVIIFCPSLLLGTKIGVILNSIFPALILTICLIVSLSFSCYKTYKNALKAQKKEKERALKKKKLNDKERMLSSIEPEFFDVIELKDTNSSTNKQINREYLLKDFYDNTTLFYGPNAPIKMDRVKWIIILELAMLIDQLLEGSKKLNSIINVKKCSFYFWLIFIIFISLCLTFTNIFYKKIKEDAKITPNILLLENPNEFNITSPAVESKITKIIFYCFMAGVISGMLGIGGGILMAPLMLELGINPKVATSTSNLFLIFTSFSNTCLYMMAGNLVVKYCLMYGILCGIFSYLGSNVLTDYVDKTGKNSVLIWTLLFISLVSLIILPINAITHAFYDLKCGNSVLIFNSFC
jgi:uncharacterized membrane protein YfcA